MKINWKVRLQNKTFLLSLIGLVITLVYQVLGLFDIVPSISENEIVNIVGMVINLLGVLGVVVDPTTDGINDSTRALTYGTVMDVRITERTESEG